MRQKNNPGSYWLPPDTEDILIKNIPEGSQWYELRTLTDCRSFYADEYDEALDTARIMKKLLPSTTLFYCTKSCGELNGHKII